MLSVHLQGVLETAVMSAPTAQRIKLLVRWKLVFTGISVNGGKIRIRLNTGNQKLFELLLLNAPWDMYKWQSCYLDNMYLLIRL